MNIQSLLFLGAAEDNDGRAACQRLADIVPNVTACFGTWADAKRFPEAALEWRGDMILSHRSRWIVPAAVLSRARVAALNIHPGTPEYPGIGATNFALYEGAKTFGATLHHMAPKVDTGDIVEVRRFPLAPDESLESITRRTYEAVDYLLSSLIFRIEHRMQLPWSSEYWTRRPFRRTELTALQTCTADMSVPELERRWRASYMKGLPRKYLAHIGDIEVGDWLRIKAAAA